MTLAAIRGATTLDEDTAEQMTERVGAMIDAIVARNDLALDDIISVFVTATPDVTCAYPAGAIRSRLGAVPLLGAQELAVDGSPARCVRVMVHADVRVGRHDVRHVYLEGAALLRPDLAERP